MKDASFKYDITYLSSKDSLTLNFSLYTDKIREFDKLVIKKEAFKLVSNLEKFFVEPQDGEIHHRYSSTFSFAKFDSLITISQSHPIILLKSKKNKLKLDIKSDDWTEQRMILLKNFQIIKVNR